MTMTAIIVDEPRNNHSVDTGPGSNEPFTYVTDTGKSVTLTSLAKPFKTAGELRTHRKDSGLDLAYYVIERDSDPEQMAAVDEMSMEEFDRFSKLWTSHSGISLGESKAS